jgi:hypothetical protein
MLLNEARAEIARLKDTTKKRKDKNMWIIDERAWNECLATQSGCDDRTWAELARREQSEAEHAGD